MVQYRSVSFLGAIYDTSLPSCPVLARFEACAACCRRGRLEHSAFRSERSDERRSAGRAGMLHCRSWLMRFVVQPFSELTVDGIAAPARHCRLFARLPSSIHGRSTFALGPPVRRLFLPSTSTGAGPVGRPPAVILQDGQSDSSRLPRFSNLVFHSFTDFDWMHCNFININY